MATFTEDFTAANGTLLTSLSPAWLGAGSRLRVGSNRCYSTNGNFSSNYAPTSPDTADQMATWTCEGTGSGSSIPGAFLRSTTDGQNGYFAYYASAWRIGKIIGGSVTIDLDTFSGDLPTTARTCEFSVVGSLLTLKIDGVERVSVVDTDLSAANEWGAMSYFADASDTRYMDDLTLADVSTGPEITTIVPDPATTGDELTITGTGFEAAQGTGGVDQEQGAVVVALTENTWADTSITADSATIESTGLKYGTQTLRVTADAGGEGIKTFVADPATGNSYVDLTSVATVGQIVTVLALATGDQLRYANELSGGGGYSVTVNADATFSIDGGTPDGVYTFEVRAWDTSDQTWGTAANQTVTIGAPPIISSLNNCRLCIGIGIGV